MLPFVNGVNIRAPHWGGAVNRILVLICLFSLVSCGFKNSADHVALPQGTGVMGGKLVKEKSELASIIVGIYDAKDNAICTGSLIAENAVLTAAHCSYTKKQNLRIVFGLDIDMTMAIREPDVRQMAIRNVKQIIINPGHNPDEEEKEVDLSDIAIMIFDGGLPPGYKPAQMLTDNSLLQRGVNVRVAGYGVSQIDLDPIDPKKVRNLQDALDYGEVICDENQRNCLSVDMSGDGVLREAAAPIATVYDTEVFLDESKGQGTCSGDSGGPAYVEQNGQLLLFGVTSRGSALCDNIGVYTNAVTFKTWIAETLAKYK